MPKHNYKFDTTVAFFPSLHWWAREGLLNIIFAVIIGGISFLAYIAASSRSINEPLLGIVVSAIGAFLTVVIFILLTYSSDWVDMVFGTVTISGHVTQTSVGKFRLRYRTHYVYRIWVNDQEVYVDENSFPAIEMGDQVEVKYYKTSRRFISLSLNKTQEYKPDEDKIREIRKSAPYKAGLVGQYVLVPITCSVIGIFMFMFGMIALSMILYVVYSLR